MESVARKPRMTRHDGISGARACIKNLAKDVADRRRPMSVPGVRDIWPDHGELANWILADYRVTTVGCCVWKHDFGIRQSRDVQAERDACWEIPSGSGAMKKTGTDIIWAPEPKDREDQYLLPNQWVIRAICAMYPSEQPPYKLSGGIRWYGGFVPS